MIGHSLGGYVALLSAVIMKMAYHRLDVYMFLYQPFFGNFRYKLADVSAQTGTVAAIIEKAMSINDQPVVVDFRVHRDAMVWPMVAAGTSNDEILIARATAPDWDSQEL